MVAIPDRLQEGIGKAEIKDVLHRFLAQVVVDAENARLRQRLVQGFVQGDCRCPISPERLLHHHTRLLRAASPQQSVHHDREHRRGYGEVVQGALPAIKSPAQLIEGGGILIAAIDVGQQTGEIAKQCVIDRPRPELGDTFMGVGAQPIQIPARRGGHADNGRQRAAMPQHVVQRGEYLAPGQIAGGTEQNQSVSRHLVSHELPPLEKDHKSAGHTLAPLRPSITRLAWGRNSAMLRTADRGDRPAR